MKIEFLDDISNGGKFKQVVSERLIRLYEFNSNEAQRFQTVIKDLIENRKEIIIDSLDFVQVINCSLTLKLSRDESGLRKLKSNNFECALSTESYQEMIECIQPFVDDDLSGYQWLPNGRSEIDFLFSPGGTW